MIRYIIFDMDGVLVNTEPMHFAVWKQLFQERGVSLEYDCYKGCIGSTGEYLCGLIYETYGRDFRGDSSIMKRFREIKNKVISSDGIPRIDGVPRRSRFCTVRAFIWRSRLRLPRNTSSSA